jgi:hypothetical protein
MFLKLSRGATTTNVTYITMHLHRQRMRRLLASDLLPKRAGQPAKALVHVSFAELCGQDVGSVLRDKWIADYRAR